MEIKNLGNNFLNQYIIKIDGGYLLIDTGYENGSKKFLKRLNKAGITEEEIKYIFITHVHDDHVGFLNNFTNAKIILCEESLERLKEGVNRSAGATSLAVYLYCKLRKGERTFPPFNDSGRCIVWDKNPNMLQSLGIQAEIINLDGHTSDSIGLLFENGLLIAGDAFMNLSINKNYLPLLIENFEAFKETLDKIINCKKIKTLYLGHGKPVSVDKLKDKADAVKNAKLRHIN